MKVMQVNTVCGTGSTGRITVDLYQSITSNGDQGFIAYGRGAAPLEMKTYKIGNSMDMYLHAIGTRITDRHGFYSKSVTKDFIKQIYDWNPDIIHLHNIHGYYLNLPILMEALYKLDRPIIWTLHDCWPFTGHCAYYDYAGCERWKIQCEECPQKLSYPKSYFLDQCKRNYLDKKSFFRKLSKLTIVTPSRWLAQQVKQSYLREFNVEIIPNGINLDIFKPTDSNFRKKNQIEDKILVLGVANIWDERKGLSSFIKLVDMLDDKYIIVLVGVNDKQSQRLPKQIICINRTNNPKELAEIYSSADVFVNPTLEDNFPTTNLESLACGTPVITYNTGGSVESITPECGSIVAKGDIDGIVNAIKSFQYKDIKDTCRKQGMMYSAKIQYEKYVRLYHEAIKDIIC